MNTNYLDIWYLNSVWSLLSSISSGDKIGIKGNLITIEKNHPFLWIKRKYNGDTRVNIFQLIEHLLSMSEYHLKEEEHINKNVSSFKYNIILGIRGLLNLRDTYIDDNRFLSIFNSSLEKIKILKIYYHEVIELDQFTALEGQIFLKNKSISNTQNIKSIIENNVNNNSSVIEKTTNNHSHNNDDNHHKSNKIKK